MWDRCSERGSRRVWDEILGREIEFNRRGSIAAITVISPKVGVVATAVENLILQVRDRVSHDEQGTFGLSCEE